MKTTLQTQFWARPLPTPPALPANKLSKIKVKDYALIGFRDTEAELEIGRHLNFLKSTFNFSTPRLYTLVSQNKKISFKKTLSDSSRIFLNFESFKWSELFFNFFRPIVCNKTEHFAFQNLLYSLDVYVCQYQLITMAIRKSFQNQMTPIHRHKSQFQLFSAFHKHPHGHNLCLLYIFDLLLISIGKPQYTSCAFMITQSEALILLSYLKSQDVITLESGTLTYSEQNLPRCLQRYFEFRGQILFTNTDENILREHHFEFLKIIFDKKEAELDHKTFETCFTHV